MASKTKNLWGASLGVGVVNTEMVSKRVGGKSRILDAGCGLGFVVSAVKAGQRYAIDINPGLIEQARKLNDSVEYSTADAVKTGFPDRFFDTVLCLDVIEHTESQRALIAEMSRILKDGGRLLISTPIPGAEFLPGAKSHTLQLHKVWGHKRLVSRDKIIQFLDEAGLRAEEEVCYMYLPARLGILGYNLIYALFAGDNKPWNSFVVGVYERFLKLVCKIDNTMKFFGPFEVLFVAVKH